MLKASRQHARNLASFAFIYKAVMMILRYISPVHRGKEGPYDTFLAGLVGGYAVFGRGRQGSVNRQVGDIRIPASFPREAPLPL